MPIWTNHPRQQLLVDLSLWSADLTDLGAQVRRLSRHADLFHLDVADGHFVPQLLFFPDLLAALRPHTGLPLHAHLMVEDPATAADWFIQAGADLISVHVETGQQALHAVDLIAGSGKAAGLAIGLDTQPGTVVPFLDRIDALVVVGTPLGTRGTPPAAHATGRVGALRELLRRHVPDRDVRILADGGIRRNSVAALAAAGAHGVVAGSLVFGSPDPAATLGWLHNLTPGQPTPPPAPPAAGGPPEPIR